LKVPLAVFTGYDSKIPFTATSFLICGGSTGDSYLRKAKAVPAARTNIRTYLFLDDRKLKDRIPTKTVEKGKY
jgi:hypothetical protein